MIRYNYINYGNSKNVNISKIYFLPQAYFGYVL